MRSSRAFVAAGTVRTNALGVRHAVIAIALAVAALWVGVGFAQEAFLGHKLSQQVSDLRRQNAVLAAQNKGYHRDIEALMSGAANEEEARLAGYSKAWEKVYLVTAPPSPTPQVSPSPSPSR